jgi:alpha-beta hydrolase superfamily lysophospholipase
MRPEQGSATELITIESEHSTLLGYLTRPRDGSVGTTVLVAPAARFSGGTAWHDVRNVLADALARRGLASLRFDWMGTGNSTGSGEVFQRGNPRTEDVLAAASELRRLGADRLLGVSSCYGSTVLLDAAAGGTAFDALALASLQPVSGDHDEGLAVKVASSRSLAGWAGRAARLHYIRDLRDPGIRARYRRVISARLRLSMEQAKSRNNALPTGYSTTVVSQLARVTASDLPLLLMYGEGDPEYQIFSELTEGPRPQVRLGPATALNISDGPLHSLNKPAAQQYFVRTATDWCATFLPTEAHSGASGDGRDS